MAIFSMTGYARMQARAAIGDSDQLAYSIALKSVNHRFLDLQFRLPSGLDALEMELRRLFKENLVRGHVEFTLSVDRSGQQKSGFNRELVGSYLAAFAAARQEHGLSCEPDLNAALRLPGALQAEQRGDEDMNVLAASVLEQVPSLLDQLKVMRAREGDSLKAILLDVLARLEEASNGVAGLIPDVEQRYQERLTQRLTAAVGNDFSRQRLLEEIAIMVERSDVSEELARMATHIGHFRDLLAAGGEMGKKLDFLLQEMNREANTLLSKTGSLAGKGTRVTELGLAMKAEIEKAREQIQNLE